MVFLPGDQWHILAVKPVSYNQVNQINLKIKFQWDTSFSFEINQEIPSD